MSLPPHADRVYAGIRYDVYHREQELFDGSFSTYELVSKKPVTWILPVIDSKILIVDEDQPGKSPATGLIAGHNYTWADPLDIAKEHLHDEVGYVAGKYMMLQVYRGINDMRYEDDLFIAKECIQTDAAQQDALAHINTRRVSFIEFIEMCRNPSFHAPVQFKFFLYETLLFKNKRHAFFEKLFDKKFEGVYY